MAGPLPLRFGPGDARAIVAYNRAVFELYARRLGRLPGKAATRRRGIGHESLLATLAHILNVHEVWLVYLVRGREGELEELFSDPRRHPKDLAGLRAYSRRVWDGVEETLESLDARALGRRVAAPWMPGRYTVRDAILQTTLEQAHHLGEVIGALWQDDVEPPEMTWIDTRRRKGALGPG